MERLRDEYKKIKDELYSLQSQPTTLDKNFAKLAALDGIDPAFKESLILIISAQTLQLQELKANGTRIATKILDAQLELINALDSYNHGAKNIKSVALHSEPNTSPKPTETKPKTNFWEFTVLQKSIIGVVFAVVVFFILAVISPSAFNTATGVFGKLFGKAPEAASIGISTKPSNITNAATNTK